MGDVERVGLGHTAVRGVPLHRSLGTALLTLQLKLEGYPRTKAAAPGWGGDVCDWSNKYSTCSGHRPEQDKLPVSRAHPCFFPSASKPDSQQEGKNLPGGIIRWLLGEKIVNVLVPFTKPQPKKVT